MLTHLQIRDFAIIDAVEVELHDGLTVLTGETGAGKSILVDALQLAVGARAGTEAIRHDAARAEIAATFDLRAADPAVRGWLTEQSIEADDELVVRRVITREGKSRAYLNGQQVPIQGLREVGALLAEIHGQHEFQSLLKPAAQRRLLDAYAGSESLATALASLHRERLDRSSALTQLEDDARDRHDRIDLLRHIREQGVQEDRSAIIHTYADFEGAAPTPRESLSTPEGLPVALSLARLHEKKGLDTLLEAAARLPDLFVWIAGEGPIEAELKAQSTRLGLDQRVRFLGWRNDRGALLAACDVVAFPSRYEPFGTVTVDAWAASRPLVAADAVGPAAYVKDGVNGLLVAKNDVDALASALGRVIYDKNLAAKLVEGGRASYESQFTKSVFQRDSLAFYERVLAHAGQFKG